MFNWVIADCAATLRILNSFYSNIFTINELIAMASILGSDIAGCVHSKALTMTGRGEKVKVFESDLNFLDEFQVLAITPNIFCSTPQVYQHYDDIHRPTHAGISSPEGFGFLGFAERTIFEMEYFFSSIIINGRRRE